MTHDIVIIGGGPAGMMAGLLFARAGLDTLVLEKHEDFLRDFRGDTVHPSTMEILDQLGMLNRFLKRPHNRIETISLSIAGRSWQLGDLRTLATPAPFIAMMPQWEFLDFLKQEAAAFPSFHLSMSNCVESLEMENGRIVQARLIDGRSVRARKLFIAADGRNSLIRRQALLPVRSYGAPMDVFWFRVPKVPEQGSALQGNITSGSMIILIDRKDYWQCAFIIPKGQAAQLKAQGMAAMRDRIAAAAPALGPLENCLCSWDDLHLLNVMLDRLQRWHLPGLLAIGDAAHAMSPVGGIGINLAIQDAVAAANILAGPLRASPNADSLLHAVQKRRHWPTMIIQAGQRTMQERVIVRALNSSTTIADAPWPVRMLDRFPMLRRIPGRIIGLGLRRERVLSPRA